MHLLRHFPYIQGTPYLVKKQKKSVNTNELKISELNAFELVTPRKICSILNVDTYSSLVSILML